MIKSFNFKKNLFSGFLLLSFLVPVFAQAQTNLTVVTVGASDITVSSAILNGSFAVNQGADLSFRPQTFFQYGETTAFGQSTQSRSHSRMQDDIQVQINNLKPNTTYYARFVAQNRGGIQYGATVSFSTLPLPTPDGGTAPSIEFQGQPGGNPNTGETPTNNTGNNNNTDNNSNNNNNNNSNNNSTNNSVSDNNQLDPVPAFVALKISDDRETFAVGDILTYLVDYQNVSETKIEDVFIRVELPESVEYLSSGEGVYLRRENSVVFDLGDLEVSERGDVKVSVRAINALREGTRVATAAIVLYANPTTGSQASAVHYDINEYDGDGQIEVAGSAGGFLPKSFLGWILIVVVLLLIILIARKIYLKHQDQIEQAKAEEELKSLLGRDPNSVMGSSVNSNKVFEDSTISSINNAPNSIDELDPSVFTSDFSQEEKNQKGDSFSTNADNSLNDWGLDGESDFSEDSGSLPKSYLDIEKKKQDFLNNLPPKG